MRPNFPENEYRRDRDTRERPRSKVRDSSRGRRDISTGRRDRDHDDKDKDRARRFDHYSPPRDKDDDPRRWRDDGKREERVTKREREREDKDKDRDSRWQTPEDRDGRLKRVAGRDRKNADDGKDRDRDKDKEKEPAWMETYVPDASGGILGGKTADGEIDSIQAWKKGMKEKEEKDKAAATKDLTPCTQPGTAGQGESQVDEMQFLRTMIKREADKKGELEVVRDIHGLVPALSK